MGTSITGDLEWDITQIGRQHQEALTAYTAASKRAAELYRREEEMECERHSVKARAIARIMEGPPILAYTPAEKLAVLDGEYLTHLANQRQVVYDKEIARSEAHVALHRADLAVAQLKALAGVR